MVMKSLRSSTQRPPLPPPLLLLLVLVLALVLVVAARGGRGDVAAQPLYERAAQPLVLA